MPLAGVKVGATAKVVDGTSQPLRGNFDSCGVVVDGHARYTEMAIRGNLWYGSTAAAGQAPGTALGTTAGFSLYNPRLSGKILSIIDGTLGYISGTLGAGTIVWAVDPADGAAPTGGTAITARSAIQSSGLPQGVVGTGTTVAATPNIGRAMAIVNASLATTATNPVTIRDEVAGLLGLVAGRTLSLQGIAAAGTTPLVAYTVFWEEIPA